MKDMECKKLILISLSSQADTAAGAIGPEKKTSLSQEMWKRDQIRLYYLPDWPIYLNWLWSQVMERFEPLLFLIVEWKEPVAISMQI